MERRERRALIDAALAEQQRRTVGLFHTMQTDDDAVLAFHRESRTPADGPPVP